MVNNFAKALLLNIYQPLGLHHPAPSGRGLAKGLLGILILASSLAFAEPSFNQIESLIANHQYSAAQSGLERIIENHPQSAKAYWAMAQANAGLGNSIRAKENLDKAIGLDPDLKFANKNEVQSLQIAVTPKHEDANQAIKPSGGFPFGLFLSLFLPALEHGYCAARNKHKLRKINRPQKRLLPQNRQPPARVHQKAQMNPKIQIHRTLRQHNHPNL